MSATKVAAICNKMERAIGLSGGGSSSSGKQQQQQQQQEKYPQINTRPHEECGFFRRTGRQYSILLISAAVCAICLILAPGTGANIYERRPQLQDADLLNFSEFDTSSGDDDDETSASEFDTEFKRSLSLDPNQVAASIQNELQLIQLQQQQQQQQDAGLGNSGLHGVIRRQLIGDGGDQVAADDNGGDEDNRETRAPSGGPSEIYLLEDKDYPKSVFENYSRLVGQISGIATLPNNDVAIFHRADRQWTSSTFNESTHQVALANNHSSSRVKDDNEQEAAAAPMELLASEKLIKNNTIMILDGENGGQVTSFGSNLFYMPHSIASDPQGNLWVSDVGRHQVMRLPVSRLIELRNRRRDGGGGDDEETNGAQQQQQMNWLPGNLSTIWPDIVLGKSFQPGNDEAHFCQPSELAISSNGLLLFVADGYCNQRVVVFLANTGQYLTSFGDELGMQVVHSLTLIEEKNLICVGDRENARILCYRAGLNGDLSSIGQLVLEVRHPIGRVFAIQAISADHLLVSSNQAGTRRYDMAILNPFTKEIKLVWTSTDLLEPHSLASTFDKQYAYAADLSKDAFKKVFKFNIIQRKQFS